MFPKSTFTCFFILATQFLTSQISIEGYLYESGNRGYIQNAAITFLDESGSESYGQVFSDETGKYNITVPSDGEYVMTVEKSPFFDFRELVSVKSNAGQDVYLEHEISRSPGYVFEITLAEKDPDPDAPRGALKGALIEVYNNTKKEEYLVIEKLESPDFQVNLIKGNHYTVLVRKEGFLSKRMEAFVDVDGCILCFEGVGEITPGVSDNLTESNSMGTLLANVEMDRYFEGKVIGLNDIYYETAKWEITNTGKQELDKIARFLKDNPDISVELGSHTDSRGKDSYNKTLSEKRARSAVNYLVKMKGVDISRITSKGYGETQLTNDCDDKNKCPEEEHAKNRRTELKILQIGNDYVFRSLRQMKADELMDEILQELSDEGEIKIFGDQDIDEVVKERSAKKSSVKPSKLEKISSTQNSVSDVKEQFEEGQNYNKTQLKNLEENETEEKVEKESAPAKTEMFAHQAVPVDNNLKTDDESISDGYKIVILFSRYKLNNEHPLFKRFENLEVYETADRNRLYMIESFETKKEAIYRTDRRYKSSFPNAYVVGFRNGVIVD